MADSDVMEDEEIAILACSTIILSATALAYNNVVKEKRHHSVWVRGYLKERDTLGAYNCLMPDLSLHDADKLRNYLRMEPSVFEELFAMLEPLITVSALVDIIRCCATCWLSNSTTRTSCRQVGQWQDQSPTS